MLPMKKCNGIEPKLCIALYRTMLVIRLFEEKIVELYPEQEMRCPVHLCIGQEAVAAGVCANLVKEDVVFSNHRAHGHYLAKGGNPNALLAEIYGKETGCSRGRGGSMHLIDRSVNFLASTAIVAGTIPLAAGAAFASKQLGRKNIAVAFFGDAAVEEGVFHETLNFSALHKLPVLFVCENNLYASQTHLSARQPGRSIFRVAEAHGIPSWQGDGNDALKVYATARDAIQRIRAGEGPALIEFTTYRLREHCGPNCDNNLGYRSESEVLLWASRCPLEQMKAQLIAEKVIDKEKLDALEKEARAIAEEAATFAKNSSFPAEGELNKYVYSE